MARSDVSTLLSAAKLRQQVTKASDYVTVSQEEAKDRGYRPITMGFGLQYVEQRAMLDNAVTTMQGVDHVLVLNKKGTMISVWRK